ncbi:unnamed protein product [Mytilus coruscus]|uniref:HECT domain-containing protein n=1 Tax=Mytilus coruscus TaxID=42192 RepID=A0A6J8D964_MYTCO|nr:unnamed protein product [Mytilus coruscus]
MDILESLMIFSVGLEQIPLLGITPEPRVEFSHPEDAMNPLTAEFPFANTCGNILKIPVFDSYVKFKQNMIAAIQCVTMFTDESSDESDEFEGFTRAELDEAEARFQQQLLLQGIGDDSDDLESEGESDTDVPGPAGDAGNIDGWHDDFLYFERGLPHLFTPTGRTGPTRIMPQDKTPLDFFKMFFNHVLLEMFIEQTDTYAKLQKENHPDENKMAWVRPSIPEMNAFFLVFVLRWA